MSTGWASTRSGRGCRLARRTRPAPQRSLSSAMCPSTQDDFSALWSACRELAYAWCERVQTPSGVLEVAREQVEDGWAMTVHFPSPLYVAAFTTARLGEAAEGGSCLRATRIGSQEGRSGPII